MLKQRDNIFYSDNCKGNFAYSTMAVKVIQDLGLTPFWYTGAGLNARRSSLHKEIYRDFYQSKVVVLVFGRGEGWRNLDDNWVMPELKNATSLGMRCLIYTTAELNPEEVNNLDLPTIPVIINENNFSSTFEKDLKQLMAGVFV